MRHSTSSHNSNYVLNCPNNLPVHVGDNRLVSLGDAVLEGDELRVFLLGGDAHDLCHGPPHGYVSEPLTARNVPQHVDVALGDQQVAVVHVAVHLHLVALERAHHLGFLEPRLDRNNFLLLVLLQAL